MSASIAPGVSSLAFWVAQQVLDGQTIKHDLLVPYLRIDAKDLDASLKTTEKGGVANVEYTLDDAKKAIAANQ
jgi:ribose transport system substrate-binding protein